MREREQPVTFPNPPVITLRMPSGRVGVPTSAFVAYLLIPTCLHHHYTAAGGGWCYHHYAYTHTAATLPPPPPFDLLPLPTAVTVFTHRRRGPRLPSAYVHLQPACRYIPPPPYLPTAFPIYLPYRLPTAGGFPITTTMVDGDGATMYCRLAW